MAIAKRKKMQPSSRMRPWNHLLEDLEGLWSHGMVGREVAAGFVPKINVLERDGELLVDAEIPGVEKEDIEVTVDGQNLIIQGEVEEESELDEAGYYRRERSTGFFFRRIPLSFAPDASAIKARYKNGVLRVSMAIPRAEKPASKKVAIG